MLQPPPKQLCILPNGAILYGRPNEAGGFTYYTDECSLSVEVWDSAITDRSTVLCALEYERLRGKDKMRLSRDQQFIPFWCKWFHRIFSWKFKKWADIEDKDIGIFFCQKCSQARIIEY